MAVVYIALGSNLNNPTEQLDQALASLRQHAEIEVAKVSSYLTNPPLKGSPPDQPDFVNAVAELHTKLSPRALLQLLQQIEQQQGRVRAERWGPRTIDLDILLYEDWVIDEPGLRIPHYDMANRVFVMQPLLEIAPGIQLPNIQ